MWWTCLVFPAARVAPAGPIALTDAPAPNVATPVRLAGVRQGPARPAGRLRFFALGDVPYSDAEYEPMEALLQDAVRGGAPFIVHVGDIKAGSQPCSDARNSRIAHLFREQPVPVLYTPGDNEWTDCHRHGAGGRDPLERLAALRRAFFEDPGVLHRDRLRPVVPDPAYPENAYLVRDGVLIALVHVVGSGNNRRPADAAAMAELSGRTAANRALLRKAVAAARAVDARAFVVVFHANAFLEDLHPPPGFAPLHDNLRMILKGFPGPVLVIHGDTHHYRLDQPFAGPRRGETELRLWRLEVPGSPLVGGVWVDVDASAGEPFRVQPVYPDVLDMLQALGGDG